MLLDLVIEPGCFTLVEDEVFSFISFDGDMDTSHIPDRLKFQLTGEPDLEPFPAVVSWDGLKELHFFNTIDNGLPFTITVEYLGGDPLFKTARGKLVKPFIIPNVEVCPGKMTSGRRNKLLSLFPGSIRLQQWTP